MEQVLGTVEYRKDIDGLRAVAVLSVLFYHAKVPLFEGGFLGVDIFFVISGFLITAILVKELEQDRFTILGFYDRRIRRIMPALLFMIAVTCVVFYTFMLPDDLENLGQSVVATLAFSNNILLWLTSGYFSDSIDIKPLAHTWSLGVEEQYYLFIPVAMAVAFRVGGRRAAMGMIAALSLASLAFCLVASRIDQDLNFFLITSRFWELGIGSLIVLSGFDPSRKNPYMAELLSGLGVVAILLSIMVFGGRSSNPDELTIIPVLGVCLIILFSRPGTSAYRLLSNRYAVFIGLISYSLYLWHQPIFVALRLSSLDEPTALDYLPYGVGAFVIATFSWRYVEHPFRDRQFMSFKKVTIWSIFVSALLIFAGSVAYFTSGFYDRWPEMASSDKNFGSRQNIAFNLAPKRFAGKTLDETPPSKNVVVIGNSFARDVINIFQQDNRLKTLSYSYVEIDPCDGLSVQQARLIVRNASFVVFGSGIDQDNLDCVKRAIRSFNLSQQQHLLVFGTKNFGWNNTGVMMLAPSERYKYRARVNLSHLKNNQLGRDSFAPETYVDLMVAMGVDRDSRAPVFTRDRKFISQDREHLTVAGARYFSERLKDHPALQPMYAAAR